jgi:hypothetical protein
MKLYLGNESANGRDLYPSDLDAAATQASRWLGAAPRSTEYHPSNATTFIVSSKLKTPNPNRTSEDTICEFCARGGHTMEKCYKFEAAKKLAKTPNPHAKGKDQKTPGAHRAPANLPIKPTAFFS